MHHFSGCNWEECRCELKRYWLVFGIAIVIFCVEIAGGLMSGSLALMSDASHVFIDAIALMTAIFIEFLIYKNPSLKYKWRPRSAYINSVLLFAASSIIIWEAARRWRDGAEILTRAMLVVAILGAIGNYIQSRILQASHEKHLTNKAMKFHVLSDLWQSLGVIFGGVLIIITGEKAIDLVMSLIIAAVMIFWGCRLMYLGKNCHEK